MPQTADAFLEDSPDETKVLPSAEDFLNEWPSAEAFLEEGASVSQMADATRATVGVVGRAIAATDFAMSGRDAPDRSQLEEGYQPDESSMTNQDVAPLGVKRRAITPLSADAFLTPIFGKFPRVTAQEVSDALSFLASASPDLTEEESQAVIDHTMKPGNLEKIVAGAQRAAVSVPESFTTPLGIVTMGTGLLPATAGRVVAGGFAVDMARHIPEQVKELRSAIASGDSERITEASGLLLASGAMTAAAGKHALTKPKTPLEQVAPLTAEAVAKVEPVPVVKESLTTEPRVFFDDAVNKYTATQFHEKWGNMSGIGGTPEAAVTALNRHVFDADKYGTWRSVNHPKSVSAENAQTQPDPTPLTTEAVRPLVETKVAVGETQTTKPITGETQATTPLTTEAVAKVVEKEPALDTPTPTPVAATGESGTPPVPAGVPPAKTSVTPEVTLAKPEGERTLTSDPEGRVTGIKNAAVDAERQSRGQPPILAPQRLANPVVWDRAMERIEREPDWQDRLVEELKEKPRTPSQDEIVALDHRYVDLQNEYSKATAEGDASFKSGNSSGVADAKARTDFLEVRLAELEQVARNVGTEWGRSGQMRQRMIREDFSLAAMEARARAAKGFEPLTEAEHAEIASLHEKLSAAEKKAVETETAANERIAGIESQKALAEARAAAATAPLYEPRVLQAAEKFASFMDKKGADALIRIKARLGQTSAGIDPTILSDVGILGAAKITRGVVDFAKWTEVMVRDLGEWFREHAQEGWDTAQAVFSKDNETFHKGVDRSTREKIKKAAQAPTPEASRASVTEGLRVAIEEGASAIEIGRYARRLAEEFIKDGIREIEPLTDAVHGVLKTVLPEITRTESRDAWTNYGKYKALDKDAIKVRLRELSTEGQKLSTIERLEAGQPGLKTGQERQPPTDSARRMQKRINELKKQLGIVSTDPATQLRSALDAIKTRNQNRIKDLRFENSTRTRIVRAKRVSPTDAEVVSQRAEIERLKAENEEIFGGKELTDEQRLQRAIAASERAEIAAEAQLSRAERGDFTKPAGSPIPESANLNEIRARTSALRQETIRLKELATPKKTPDEIAIQSLKTRMASEKADLERRLAEGDFSPRRGPKRELPLDRETALARAEVETLRDTFKRKLAKHEYDRKGRAEKIWIGTKEAVNLSRAILTSWDVSAVFRQGGFIGFGNPARAARALKPMFEALVSEKRAAAIEQELLARPNAKFYASSKLFLAPREGGRLTGMEEAFMSRLASRIPGVGASQRAYITFLNKLRADTFDALKDNLTAATPEELSAIANYVNVATGRGNLGKVAGAAETLSTVFFSPRLVASRFQLIAGEPMYRGSANTRFIVAKEYAKFLTGMATFLGLSFLAGATIETDPRSSDFGKLKFGNTRVDPMGGLSQVTVLVSRLASGEKADLKGKVEAIRGKVPFGKDTSADVIARFLRTKLSPIVGSGVDALTGSNVVGEPVTAGSVAINAVVPLAFRDIYDVMREQGIPEGTAIGILSLFGMGVQNYETKGK